MNTQLRIIIGILFTLLTCVPLGMIAYNDLGPAGLGLGPNSGKTVMEKRAESLAGKQVEVGADIYAQYCTACHGKKGEGIPQLAPALNRKDLLDGRRQKDVGWAGNIPAFIKDTVAAGRPVQTRPDLYSARMPTWSQQFGGALRPDQIDAVVAFVMNWKDSAPEVNAYPPSAGPLPTATAGPSPTPAPTRAGVIAQCQTVPAQYTGKRSPYAFDDRAAIAAGKQIYDENCASCHGNAGRGDGLAAGALNPKPVAFTDRAFMEGMPVDCHFFRIAEGGPPINNLPSVMVAWKARLSEDQIWRVLIYERSFSGVR